MTAPQVTIAADEWTDLRYDTLARLLRLPGGRDHALILCMRIRAWQTEHYTPAAPTYCVDHALADGVLGDGGAAALVRARLAVETPDGLFIDGSDRPGRIDWLHRLQEQGRARQAGAATDAASHPRKRKSRDKEVAAAPAPAPAAARLQVDSSSSSLPEIEDLSPAREAPTPAPAAPPAPAAARWEDTPEVLERRALADEILRELEAARARAADALGVEIRPLVMFDPGKRTLGDMLRSAATPAQRTELVAQLKHAIAAAEAETVARTNSIEWFTGAIFAPANFRRLASKPLDASARPRAGPRGAAAPEPPRRIKTL